MSDKEPEFTAADFETLAGLDFRPTCGWPLQGNGYCTNPADFTAREHCCKHGSHPRVICRAHMQEIVTVAHRAFPMHCWQCRKLFPTSEDWVGGFAHL